ncbi:hypothetical protein DQ353_17085 [Arthrobacter sp. AQ5-05]|nr:hypothetical protein DQ353_17085 [Arthrobacter sp. AQ5-05]
MQRLSTTGKTLGFFQIAVPNATLWFERCETVGKYLTSWKIGCSVRFFEPNECCQMMVGQCWWPTVITIMYEERSTDAR